MSRLKSWWSQSDQFDWVTTFLRQRDLIRPAQVILAIVSASARSQASAETPPSSSKPIDTGDRMLVRLRFSRATRLAAAQLRESNRFPSYMQDRLGYPVHHVTGDTTLLVTFILLN